MLSHSTQVYDLQMSHRLRSNNKQGAIGSTNTTKLTSHSRKATPGGNILQKLNALTEQLKLMIICSLGANTY